MNEQVDRVAAALQRAGLSLLTGVTGSGFSLRLIDALLRRDVTYLPACHEGAAAIMAGAYAHVTGALAGVVTIKGPGLANLVPGQVSNAYETWPVVSLSEAYASSRGGRAHKWLDQRRIMAGVVKGYGTFGDPDETVAAAVREARAEVPGPVHLDVPSRPEGAWEDSSHVQAQPEDDVRALSQLRRATKPVVILGSAAARRGWTASTQWKCPVFTTFAAKGAVDETDPSAAGVYTGEGGVCAPETSLLAAADVVIGIGLRNTEVLTPRSFACPFINFDDAPASLAEGFPEARVLPGAAGVRVHETLDSLRAWGQEEVAAARRIVIDRLTRDGWVPASVLLTLQQGLPDARLVVDTGLFCTAVEHVWRASRVTDVLASANGRFMGTAIPMAIGAALAHADRAVVCVVGDGGLPPAIAEFRTCVTRGLPVLLVLMTDGRYGSVLGPPGSRGLAEVAATIPDPSWAAIMERFGCPALRTVNPTEIDEALQRWNRTSPMFLEVPFDPSVYARSIDEVR